MTSSSVISARPGSGEAGDSSENGKMVCEPSGVLFLRRSSSGELATGGGGRIDAIAIGLQINI